MLLCTEKGFLQVEILLSNIVLCAILAIMKLSQWAEEQGLTYRGAWRMWKAGQLPVPAEQLPTGTLLVKAAKSPTNAVGLYARVFSSDQKKDARVPFFGTGRYSPVYPEIWKSIQRTEVSILFW